MEYIGKQGSREIEEEYMLLALRLLGLSINLRLRTLIVVLQTIQDEVNHSVFDEYG